MPTGTPPPMPHASWEMHKAKAEAAYQAYLKVQTRIERHEKLAADMYRDNDRLAARWLTSDESDDAWRYRVLCGLRSVHQTIIAMETAMASLYD